MAGAVVGALISALDSDNVSQLRPFARRRATNAALTGAILALYREDHVRNQCYAADVVPMYSMSDFRRFFRITPETFEIIYEYVGNCPELHLVTDHGGRPAIPVDKQLLMTLWYIASQETIRSIADRFNVTDSAVVRCRDRVMAAVVNHIMEKLIKWPNDNEQLDIARRFARPHGFPNVIGAIDGTHIEIKAPTDNPQAYVNRKMYHSVVLQAVSREDMRFTHCYTGWPGSVHDARVLRNSNLWDEGLLLCGNGHLLGDGAYPVRRWLMTPYRDNGHLTDQQKNYNFSLSAARQVVERSFALLKCRFRRLRYIDVHNMPDLLQIIMTCCIFHNVCIISQDRNNEDFVAEMQNVPLGPVANIGIVVENEAEGVLKRDIIARQIP